MFSVRSGHPQHTNALARALELRVGTGLPVMDLTVTNPTRVDLPLPHDEIAAALATPIHAYEPDPLGLPTAREALARHLGVAHAERILLTTSTSEAYAFIFKVLCDPGDDVLVPEPSYPLFAHLAALEGVHLRPYPLRWDGTWHMESGALLNARTERSRAVIVVSPNNPTGSVLEDGDIAQLRALGLPVVADEVFADYPLEGRPPWRRAADAGDLLVFSLGGLSKSCVMPHLKLGWTVVTGPDAQVAAAMQRLELVADTFLSPGAPVMHALPRLLEVGERARALVHARVREGLDVVRAAAGGASFSVLPVQAGWSVVIRMPNTRTDEAWALDLLERGVHVQPGYFFDFHAPAMLVVSLLVQPRVLEQGMAVVAARAAAG